MTAVRCQAGYHHAPKDGSCPCGAVSRHPVAPAAEESAEERVARAIHQEQNRGASWHLAAGYIRDEYRRLAAAAIAAMRPAPDAPQADGPSFEQLLRDPHEQFDRQSELRAAILASIQEYTDAPPADVHRHTGRCLVTADVRAYVQQLADLHAKATDHRLLPDEENAAREQARYELPRMVPKLLAALTAVLDLADELDFHRHSYPARGLYADRIRDAVAAAAGGTL